MRRGLLPILLLMSLAGCSQSATEHARTRAIQPKSETYSGYTVQVAAFHDRAQADRVVAALSEFGYTAWVAAKNPGEWRPWYRVCVGRFAMLREAQVTKQALQGNGYADSFVRAVR